MEKIILDTNILYSVTGLSINNKVTDLSKQFELWTTTVSLIECIVKYKDDLDSLKTVFSKIKSEEIKLISIGHAPLSNSIILRIAEADSIQSISNEIDEIVKFKIDREAIFLGWIFVVVMVGFFEVLISKEGYGFVDNNKKNMQLYNIQSLLEGNSGYVYEFFKNEIARGYKENNEQKVVLSALNEMILSSLSVFHYNYHQIKTGVMNAEGLSKDEDILNNLTTSLRGDNLHIKLKKYLDNPLSIVSKKRNYQIIEKYLNEMNEGLKIENNLTVKSVSFLIKKIEKSLKHKSKIRKNDIFDFLQVFSLGLPQYKILTLDKGFISLLKEVDTESWDLIQKLGYT